MWMTVWYAGYAHCMPCIPDSHPHRITITKCRKNPVVFLMIGTVARSM